MATLREQEREALARALTTPDILVMVDPGGKLARAVEAILTARLAKVEALADKWHHPLHGDACWGCAIDRALASDPTHAQGEQKCTVNLLGGTCPVRSLCPVHRCTEERCRCEDDHTHAQDADGGRL